MSGPGESSATRLQRGLRLAAEIGLVSLTIGVVLGAARGLSTVAPGVATALRLLVHPLALAATVALFFVLRMRRSRPKPAASRSGSTSP